MKATFQVLNPPAQYFVRLRTDRVASALVSLNGVTVIDPSHQFNENVTTIETPVTLNAVNELAVEVRGGPGGAIVADIVGIDNDLPTILRRQRRRVCWAVVSQDVEDVLSSGE